jgi:hypothetical protein
LREIERMSLAAPPPNRAIEACEVRSSRWPRIAYRQGADGSAVDATRDLTIDAVVGKVSKIVHEFGGDYWEGGVESSSYEPTFDDLFR